MDALRMDSSAGVRSVSLQYDQPLALRWSRSGGVSRRPGCASSASRPATSEVCRTHGQAMTASLAPAATLPDYTPKDQDARQLGPWMAWGDHRRGRMRSSLPRERRHASLGLIGYALTTSCHVGALSAGLSSCTLAERY